MGVSSRQTPFYVWLIDQLGVEGPSYCADSRSSGECPLFIFFKEAC